MPTSASLSQFSNQCQLVRFHKHIVKICVSFFKCPGIWDSGSNVRVEVVSPSRTPCQLKKPSGPRTRRISCWTEQKILVLLTNTGSFICPPGKFLPRFFDGLRPPCLNDMQTGQKTRFIMKLLLKIDWRRKGFVHLCNNFATSEHWTLNHR